MKKQLLCKVTMLSILATSLIPSNALAVSPDVLAKLKDVPATKMELKDFTREATIYLVGKDGEKKNTGKDFENGYKTLNNRTSVGIRDLSEALGVEIEWDKENRVVILKTEGKELVYPVDKKVMANNGELVELDTSSTIAPGMNRTFIPLRSIAETLGYKVTWDQPTFTATLYAPGVEVDKKEEPKPEQKPEQKPNADGVIPLGEDKFKIPNYKKVNKPYVKPRLEKKGNYYLRLDPIRDLKKDVLDFKNKGMEVSGSKEVRFGPELKPLNLISSGFDISGMDLKIKEKYEAPFLKYYGQTNDKARPVISVLEDGQLDANIRNFVGIDQDPTFQKVWLTLDWIDGYYPQYLVLDDGTLALYGGLTGIYVRDFNKDLVGKSITGIVYRSDDEETCEQYKCYLQVNIEPIYIPDIGYKGGSINF